MCASQSAVFRRRYALGVWFHTLKKNGVLLFVAENGISCLNLTTPKIQATFGGKVSNSWPKKKYSIITWGVKNRPKVPGLLVVSAHPAPPPPGRGVLPTSQPGLVSGDYPGSKKAKFSAASSQKKQKESTAKYMRTSCFCIQS